VSEVTTLRKAGVAQKVGTPSSVTVLEVDSSNNVTVAKGTTVPTATDAGFATGCFFIKTTGGAGTTIYINEGSATSCSFSAVSSASAVATVTGGTGITAATVGAGVTVSSSTGYTPTHIVKFAGSSTPEVDIDSSVVVTVTGALAASDIALAVVKAATNAVYVTKAVVTNDTLTVTLSGAGGAGTSVYYEILRAVS
jgi:hypothetical protein